MVADVGRDCIRARGSGAVRPAAARSPQLRGRQAQSAARPGTPTRSARSGQVLRQEGRTGVRVAVARGDGEPGQLQHRVAARARSSVQERLGRQDQGRARRTPAARARRAERFERVHRVRRPVAVELDPAHLEPVVARRWPARPWPGGAPPGVIDPTGLVRRAARPARTGRAPGPSASAASWATARWARWIGIERPAEDAERPGDDRVRPGLAAHTRSQGCASHSSSTAADPDQVTRPRSRRVAAPRRCPGGRGRAGNARPTPRHRSWSGRRCARCAGRGRGRRRRRRARR